MQPRWAFAGCKGQGEATLRPLVERGLVPSALFSLPRLDPRDYAYFEEVARRFEVPFRTSESLVEAVSMLKEMDLLVVSKFSLLPASVFQAPRLGAVNFHPSLLPAYRGVHPISWALVRGETRTGVTAHSIDEGIDTGVRRLQCVVSIDDSDDIWSLTAKVETAAGRLAVELMEHVQSKGDLPPPIPAQAQGGFYARRRGPDDGRIVWAQAPAAVRNLVRALAPPLPSAFCFRADGSRVEVTQCRIPVPQVSGKPGEVIAALGNGQYRIGADGGVCDVNVSSPLRVGEVLT